MIVVSTPKWMQSLNLLIITCDEIHQSTTAGEKVKSNGMYNTASPKYDFSKFTVWCVRISEPKTNHCHVKTTNSGPCIVCLKRMRELGFGKVAFSNKKGEIEIHKIKEYNKVALTSSQRLRVKNRNKIKNTYSKINFRGIVV